MSTSGAQGGAHRGYYTTAERVRAAAAFAASKFGNVSLVEAVRKAFKGMQWQKPANLKPVCERWWNRLRTTGSVKSAPRGRSRRKLTDAAAREAAALVKAGRVVTVTRQGGPTYQQRLFFGSIADALRHLPRLVAILEAAGVSAEHLLRRMHDVDPELKWGPLDAKPRLSPQNIAERREYARHMLHKHARDPTFVQRVLFIDEFKPMLLGGGAQDIKAWYDAHSDGCRPVIPGVGMAGSPPVRVCAYVCVSGDLGLVDFQYTSGTTGFPKDWPPHPMPGTTFEDIYKDPTWQVGVMHVQP